MDDEASATAARLDKSDELSQWLALLHAPGIGSVTLARLLDTFTTPAGVLAAAATGELRRFASIKEHSAEFLADPDWSLVEKDLAWLRSGADRHILTPDSRHYPDLLREIPDPPPILFVHGDVALLNAPQLAIVGSRNPTPLGLETSHDFAQGLVTSGLTITSGLALGVDAAAHAGALAGGGTTVAVTGTGLDRVYPASHRRLAHQIAANGALVSEFPPGTPPRADHFPRRNRIISGLSLGTLVTEAAPHSGSLITARLAAEQGREVFAIPGSIHNPLARGCHRLLRNGAKLVEEIYDIIEELVQFMPVTVQSDGESRRDTPRDHGLDQRQQKVIQNLGFEPTSVDTLIERTGFTADILTTTLLALELADLVATAPGGFYMRRTNQ